MHEFGQATKQQATPERMSQRGGAQRVAVLAQVPWIGAPEAEPETTEPAAPPVLLQTTEVSAAFDFAPLSVVAATDRAVEEVSAAVISEEPPQPTREPVLRRIDRPSLPIEPDEPKEPLLDLPETASPELDDYLSPEAIPGKQRRAVDVRIAEQTVADWEQPAPGWTEIALAVHAAVAPHARWLLLIALLAFAGLVLLVMRNPDPAPEFAPPRDFIPVAADDEPVAPLERVPDVPQPLIVGDDPVVNDEPIELETEQPFVPRAAGPGEIARRSLASAEDVASVETPNDVPPSYPSTGLPSTTPSQPPVARLSHQILPHTEQARHEDHESRVH